MFLMKLFRQKESLFPPVYAETALKINKIFVPEQSPMVKLTYDCLLRV